MAGCGVIIVLMIFCVAIYCCCRCCKRSSNREIGVAKHQPGTIQMQEAGMGAGTMGAPLDGKKKHRNQPLNTSDEEQQDDVTKQVAADPNSFMGGS